MAIDDSDTRMLRRLTPAPAPAPSSANVGTPFGQVGSVSKLQPTVTIGGAPAGYKPTTTLQPTVTIGGAPAGYAPVTTPNYITGVGVKTPTTPTPTAPATTTALPVVPPVVLPPGTKFPKAGTLLRYERGSTANTKTPIYADGNGGEYAGPEEVNTLVPGSTGTTTESERTLAKDTFANTLALMMGKNESAQPWVQEMYQLASGFYKTGSTIDESLNFALYEAKDKGLAPQFTKRFKGVFALQERLQKGEAISVPTIAEFVKAESDMGDVLREAGLTDLANQEFLGDIIGTGKSVLEVGRIISQTFEAIDTAPKSLKDTLNQYFPGVDRVSIARALLSGPEGYKALQNKVEAVGILSAAGSQGINVDLATAGDIAARGFNYEQALTGFGQVNQLQRANVLAEFEGGKYTQQQAQKAVFEQSQAEKDRLEALKLKEMARFQGGPGLAPSALRGQRARDIL